MRLVYVYVSLQRRDPVGRAAFIEMSSSERDPLKAAEAKANALFSAHHSVALDQDIMPSWVSYGKAVEYRDRLLEFPAAHELFPHPFDLRTLPRVVGVAT